MNRPDPRSRFSPVAAAYGRGRPTYPPALLDWIVAEAGLHAGDAVADVGCGTGIATRLLAERGLHVIGIDPSEAMLAEARSAPGAAQYQRGEAAATGLLDASQALVSVAQALHWFDLPAALAEFRRVLKPGGTVAAFWNERAPGEFMDAYDGLLRRYSSEYCGRERARATIAAVRARPEAVEPREHDFAHVQELAWDTLVDRVQSSSYVAHGVADRAGFLQALHELYAIHAHAGRVRFDYRTLGVVFGLSSETPAT